jgi:hypothetical protein
MGWRPHSNLPVIYRSLRFDPTAKWDPQSVLTSAHSQKTASTTSPNNNGVKVKGGGGFIHCGMKLAWFGIVAIKHWASL